MNTIIRKGNTEDFPALFEMIKETAEFAKKLNAVKNSIEQMKSEQEFFSFYIAEKDGKIIGTAVYFFAYFSWVGKTLYLDELYVKPNYRGKKVGSKLLRKIFETAKEEQCHWLRWQVLDWNKNAIALYKKIGARISNDHLNSDFNEKDIEKFLNKRRLI